MDAFTLAAKLTLDSSEFETGLKNAEDNSTGSITKWGVAAGQLIGNMTTKGVTGLVKFAKESVETGEEFDAMMSKVQAVSGATGEDFDALRQKALYMGQTTSFTATEAAEALAYMGQAGWDTDQMLAGLPAVLNLAAAGGTGLGETASIVTNALNAFGMTAEDASTFADMLAVTAASADTNIGLMGETFKYVAANAGGMKISAMDVAESIGLMANAGVKGSQAGTALSMILSRIATDAGATKDELGALGLMEQNLGAKVYDDQGNFRAWSDILADARENWKKLTTEQQANLATQIAGQRALPAFLALMNASTDTVGELRTELENSEGSAARMSETMLDNLKGDLTLMNSALDGLKILVSDEYKSSLRSFVSTFTEELGKMSTAFQEGGLAGMFTELSGWIINGISSALSDPNITVDGANEFGTALGAFVGNLINDLVNTAPQLISGLFEAGINLAGGIVKGLFAGLFGAGPDSVYGYLQNAEDKRDDLIADANKTAVEANGIVTYMETLVSKYGEAAKESGEWASALSNLEQLIPGITGAINDEGKALSDTTQNLRDYIEEHKQKAIQDAADAYTADLRNKYEAKQLELGKAQIDMEVARYQQEEALTELAKSYIESRKQYRDNMPVEAWFADELEQYQDAESLMAAVLGDNSGYLMSTLLNNARQYANANGGEDQTDYEGLSKAYQDATTTYNTNAAKIDSLTGEVGQLQTQLNVAEAAAQRMAAQMASFTVPTFNMPSAGADATPQAKGDWYVPYDNYPSLLHRGEMVLTASQARRYREDEGGGISAEVIAEAIQRAFLGLTMELNGDQVGRVFGDQTTGRISDNLADINARRRYGYGG